MNTLITFESDMDILRNAEQERGKAMAAFFRWLFAERKQVKSSEVSGDIVAAE